jgi:predicted RNA binding protein YcfA (HicA-like mRNA interferase family)
VKPKPSRPREVEAVVLQVGFQFIREGKGAHKIYAHPDGRMTSISFHPGDVPTGTLRKIIAHIGLTVAEFNDMV